MASSPLRAGPETCSANTAADQSRGFGRCLQRSRGHTPATQTSFACADSFARRAAVALISRTCSPNPIAPAELHWRAKVFVSITRAPRPRRRRESSARAPAAQQSSSSSAPAARRHRATSCRPRHRRKGAGSGFLKQIHRLRLALARGRGQSDRAGHLNYPALLA